MDSGVYPATMDVFTILEMPTTTLFILPHLPTAQTMKWTSAGYLVFEETGDVQSCLKKLLANEYPVFRLGCIHMACVLCLSPQQSCPRPPLQVDLKRFLRNYNFDGLRVG